MAQPTAQQQQQTGESPTVQKMDPNFVLSLARDNKANELAALVRQLGVPVNTANKVGAEVWLVCLSLARVLLTASAVFPVADGANSAARSSTVGQPGRHPRVDTTRRQPQCPKHEVRPPAHRQQQHIHMLPHTKQASKT
jgi:hypothetical protein